MRRTKRFFFLFNNTRLLRLLFFLGKKLHHNVSYRLWRLSNKTQNQDILMKTNKEVKTINLLVRTKLDGCEVLQLITINSLSITSKLF